MLVPSSSLQVDRVAQRLAELPLDSSRPLLQTFVVPENARAHSPCLESRYSSSKTWAVPVLAVPILRVMHRLCIHEC